MYINPRLHKPLIAFGGLVAGAAAGWTGSYFQSRRTTSLLLKHIAELEEENRVLMVEVTPKIEELKAELRKRTAKMDEVTDLINEAAEELEKEAPKEHPSEEGWEPIKAEDLPTLDHTLPEERPVAPNLELIKNVFPDENDRPEEWNQEAEDATRQSFPGRPYIISYAEFADNSFGFTQKTVTFYEGDEVLVDEHDVPIYDVASEVGPIVFGKGSGDPNICYVRNKRSKHEYEVIRDPGHFAVERHGLDIEEKYEEGDIKHSAIRRMRRED